MIRLLSIVCVALWLSGCAGQATNATANNVESKSCDQTYPAVRAPSSTEKACAEKNCPTKKK